MPDSAAKASMARERTFRRMRARRISTPARASFGDGFFNGEVPRKVIDEYTSPPKSGPPKGA